MSGIEERLERLEAETRRARSALGLLALASLAGFITLLVWMETHARERAHFATIEARQIIVDPGKGRPLIRLGADENGISRIVIGSDRRNESGIGFGLPPVGGQLFINAERGKLHTNLGAGQMGFADAAGMEQMHIEHDLLVLSDSAGLSVLRGADIRRLRANARSGR